ncbi:hypothetical protein GOP47_0001023, partial [Adiantum capillus-veneris]
RGCDWNLAAESERTKRTDGSARAKRAKYKKASWPFKDFMCVRQSCRTFSSRRQFGRILVRLKGELLQCTDDCPSLCQAAVCMTCRCGDLVAVVPAAGSRGQLFVDHGCAGNAGRGPERALRNLPGCSCWGDLLHAVLPKIIGGHVRQKGTEQARSSRRRTGGRGGRLCLHLRGG